jgi:hypothetical protein
METKTTFPTCPNCGTHHWKLRGDGAVTIWNNAYGKLNFATDTDEVSSLECIDCGLEPDEELFDAILESFGHADPAQSADYVLTDLVDGDAS